MQCANCGPSLALNIGRMKKLSFNNVYFMAILGLLQACGNPFNIKDSCDNGFYETNTGTRMSWPDGSHVDFDMHQSVPAEFRDAIKGASEQYNSLFSATEISMYEGQKIKDFRGLPVEVTGDHVNGIYWVREDIWPWAESDPNAIAMTVTTFSRDNITESDIFYREKAYTKPNDNVEATTSSIKLPSIGGINGLMKASQVLFPKLGINSNQMIQAAYSPLETNNNRIEHRVYMVSVHELGHSMGRCHSEEPASIMWPQVGPGNEEMRQAPFSDGDISTFESAYSLK